MSKTYRVGTRGSALALTQTRQIIGWLRERRPRLSFEIVEIVTHGDRFQSTPIAQMGAAVESGIFNSGLEEALLERRVELATCSFKDVESALAEGLRAVPVGRREDPRDVLLSRHGRGLEGLPPGAVLATSSPRRTSQLLALRPDLRFQPLRGNITTRVERDVLRFDGVVLAAAGLLRLGLQGHITEWFDPARVMPAPAQGVLGCEYAAEREDVAALVESLRDAPTAQAALAEKALLVRLSGGCYAPLGVLGEVQGESLRLRARACSRDGQRVAEGGAEGPAAEWRKLVESLAVKLEAQGAQEIVAETRAALLASGGVRSEP